MSHFGIRQAVIDDADGIARVHVETWRDAYRGIVPDVHLASLDMHKRAEGWREILSAIKGYAFVAVKPSGEIVGWATGGPEKTGDATYTGEISGIYVAPAAQGGGIGRRLMRAAGHRLAADGHRAMLVWVLAANLPARRFYETLGGQRLTDKHRYDDIGGVLLDAVAYGWTHLGLI